MADDSDSLGDLTVNVTGDFSELQDALDAAATAAQDGADQITEALSGIEDASTEVGTSAGASFAELGDAAETAASDLDAAAAAAAELGDSFGELTTGDAIAQISEEALDAGESMQEASSDAVNLADSLMGVGSSAEDIAQIQDILADVPNALEAVLSPAQNATQAVSDLADRVDWLPDAFGQAASSSQQMADALTQLADQAQEDGNATGSLADAISQITEASGLAGAALQTFQDILQADADLGMSLEQSLQNMADAANTLGAEVSGAASAALQQFAEDEQAALDSTEGLYQGLQQVSDGATEAAGAINNAASAEEEMGAAAREAESGLAEMAGALVGLMLLSELANELKEFAESALEAYGETQNLATVLQLLGASAESAESTIDELSDMSLTLAVPFQGLESATQRLTLAFQGVKDVDITNVLTAAADAAAVSGKSFDTVTTALQRIATTGQVTARQLLSLGVTWQQLADTAGTSISQVQALLKKGGQDAIADLNLVTQTIEAVAGGAAEAIAQNVSGQMEILSNEVTLALDKIGQDIAPMAVTVIQALDSIVQEVRELATDFQQLSPVVQDTIVAAAGLAAGVVILGAGLSLVGFALQGLIELGEGVTTVIGLMTTAAVSSAEAETAAAAATTAHGAAAATAATEIEGMTAAETGLAGAGTEAAAATGAAGLGGSLLALAPLLASAGAAILVTVANIQSLKGQWDAAMSDIRSNNIVSAINAGASLQSLQDIGNSVAQVRTALSGMGTSAATVMQAITTSTQTPIQTLYDMGYSAQQVQTALKGIGTAAVSAWQAFDSGSTIEQMQQVGMNVDAITKALNSMGAAAKQSFSAIASAASDASGGIDIFKSGITLLGSGLQTLSPTAQAVAANVKKLEQNLTDAQGDVLQFKSALDGSQTSLNNYNAAQVKLASAEQALDNALGLTATSTTDAIDPITTFAAAQGKLADGVTNAGDVLKWLNDLMAQGVTSVNGLSIATQLLPAAEANLTAAQNKLTSAIGAGNDSVNAFVADATKLSTQLGSTAQAYVELNNYAVQTPTITLAAGIAFDKLQSQAKALGIQVTQVGDNLEFSVAPGAKVAADAVQPLIDQLNDLYGVQVETITVNGQAVRTFQSLQQTLQNGQTAVSQFGSTATVAANGVLVFKGSADSAAQSFDAANTKVIQMNGSVTTLGGASTSTGAQVINLSHSVSATTQAAIDYNVAMSDAADTDATAEGATSNLVTITNDLTASATDATGATNAEADAFLQLAADADDAANAVNNLNNAQKGSGGGGGKNTDNNASALEAYAGALGNNAFLSQFVTEGSAAGATGVGIDQILQNSATNMAQNLANATNEIVTTAEGIFVPVQDAAQIAAGTMTILNGQLVTVTANTAKQTAVASTNTSATSTNTTATTTNTTSTDTNSTSTDENSGSMTDNSTAVDADTQAFIANATAVSAAGGSVTGNITAINTQTQATTQQTTATDTQTEATDQQTTATTTQTGAVDDQTAAAGNTTQAMYDLTAAQQAAINASDDQLYQIENASSATAALTTDATNAGTAMSEFGNDITAAGTATNANTQVVEGSTGAIGQLTTITAQMTTTMSEFGSAVQMSTAQAEALGATIQGQTAAFVEGSTSNSGVQTLGSGSTFESLAQAIAAGATINGLTPGQAGYGQMSAIVEGGAGAVPGSNPNDYVPPGGFVLPNGQTAQPGTEYGSNNYGPAGNGGVQLTVNVTGNSVTSAALVNQLANQVSNVIVTNLRTNAGLKN